MKAVGLVLLAVGAVALVFGGIGYNRQTTIFDVGGMKATATEHRSIPIAPIVGAMVLVGGVALLVVDKRRA